MVLISVIVCCYMHVSKAQLAGIQNDSTKIYVTKEACPAALTKYIDEDKLKTTAVLFVFNQSLHPLGKYEFYDGDSRVKFLRIPMRMNRCTMMYIDTGLHLFHTMYQQLTEPVFYEAGKIYMARLFSRSIWPTGGISVIKKNDKGEPVEYAAVLFEYINGEQAGQFLEKMKKTAVLVNE